MSKKKNKHSDGGMVYSTNPNFQFGETHDEEDTLPPSEQLLHVHRETKGRGGKAVVIVRSFTGPEEDLSELAKKVKAHCGTGGSVKDGEIIIQGDQREKVMNYLEKAGYRTKRVGG